MTLRELMTGNLQTSQNTTVIQLGAQASQKTGNSGGTSVFGEILGNKISSAERQTSVKRNDINHAPATDKRPDRMPAAKEENSPKFQTYREASDNAARAASSKPGMDAGTRASERKDRKLDEVEDNSKKDTTRDSSQNNMIQALAQVLGLDMGDLQKLLKEAGVSSESFNNGKDLSGNVAKLSQLLGLDTEQQGTLMKLLKMTGEALGIQEQIAASNTTEQANLPENAQIIDGETNSAKTTEARIEVLDLRDGNQSGKQETIRTDFDSLLARLNEKIKFRLNEIGNRLENDQSAVEADLRAMLQPMPDKAAGKVQEPAQTDPEATSNTTNGPGTANTAAGQTDSAPAENDGSGRQAEAGTEREAAVQQPVAAVGKESQPHAVFQAIQADRIQNADPVQKTAAVRTPVEPREIISQVMEKAKVILTPDKSEMIMDLKPDSLGKISLKVVTENGMVMAKFVADSQQVKQVLESNMQLLKDSLERQGMNVQGFSVSVRQDSNRQSAQWSGQESGKSRRTGGTGYRPGGIEGIPATTNETIARNNPYTWGGSTINLTA